MLMALFFLVVCLTAGAILLTSATAAAAKERNRYQEQQAYLAVSSAAQLLKGRMGGSSYVVTAVPEDTGKKDEQGEPVWAYHTRTDKIPAKGNLLTDNIGADGAVGTLAGEYTISADGTGCGDALKVRVSYAMDRDSKTAVFTLTDDATGRYSMQVVFSATTTPADKLGQFGIYWDGGTIAKGAGSHA